MSLNGPIVLIEDDEDDQYLIRTILKDLDVKNEVRLFENGEQALQYLLVTSEKPFIIICDINMPLMNGLELRDYIDQDPQLKKKSIPFIFLSTSANKHLINKAFSSTIQGFYKKEHDYEAFKNHVHLILNYWKECLHPNNL